MDAASNKGVLAMMNPDSNSDSTNEKWDINGRILPTTGCVN